jgi:hypothetical protein
MVNPPDVGMMWELDDVDILMEYYDLFMQWGEETERALTEEEEKYLEEIGQFFSRWDDFKFSAYV